MAEVVNIVSQIASKTNTLNARFPLIALQHDIKQSYKEFEGIEIDPTLYIVTKSSPDYTAGQRIEKIFKPYLYPIREELINQIARSGYFQQQTVQEVIDSCEWYDRLYWGRAQVMGNTGNTFNDWVDAIEINFSGLIIMNGCNVQTPVAPVLITAMTGAMGRYIYLTFNFEMAQPAAEAVESIDVGVGSNEIVGQTLTVSTADKRIMLLDLGEDAIQPGDAVTITIPSGLLSSLDGVAFGGCNGKIVVNNVQL